MNQKHTISVAHPLFIGNEERYVRECINDCWISSHGRFIGLFENSFADFCEVTHAVACSNGTTALHLALLALGVTVGDEVLVPTLTYIATANAVVYCGAKPVFVDSEPHTWNMDAEQLEKKVIAKTKAIIAVHLYGHPCEMDAIMKIANRHGLFVIEDAAEAHGALYRGRKVGSLGHLATFSFFGNKIITTGEGGMITTSDGRLADTLRLLRNQGMDRLRRYWFPVIGYNYRMTNLQAAIGVAQMEKIDSHIERRHLVAAWYRKHLSHLSHMVVNQMASPWVAHAYWSFTVLIEPECSSSRDEIITELGRCGIETRPMFYPLHIMPPYREPDGSYPIAEALSKRGISLPTHGHLTEAEIAHIVSQLQLNLCTELAHVF